MYVCMYVCMRPPSPLDTREARARARGSTIFETFKAENAEICTPPRPCPPAPWTPERPEHGRGGVRFSRLSRLKMLKSVLPRARAPHRPGPRRGQSTGAGEYDFGDFQGYITYIYIHTYTYTRACVRAPHVHDCAGGWLGGWACWVCLCVCVCVCVCGCGCGGCVRAWVRVWPPTRAVFLGFLPCWTGLAGLVLVEGQPCLRHGPGEGALKVLLSC